MESAAKQQLQQNHMLLDQIRAIQRSSIAYAQPSRIHTLSAQPQP
jgi:hypothetical protein